MKAEIVRVTPEMADKWLDLNGRNRNINKSRVNMYVKDMQMGKWELNGEPICFSETGLLKNGQHRLSAVSKSGCTVKFLVVRGVPDDVSVYDRGRSRSATDSMIISGMPKELANNTTVAIAKLHEYIRTGSSHMSDGEVETWLNKHEASVLKIGSIPGSKNADVNTKHAVIGTAMVYALEGGVSFDLLARFAECFKTGFYSDDTERAAIVLRNDIINHRIEMRMGSYTRKMACFKVEKAISDFDAGVKRKVSYANWNKPVYSAKEVGDESD